MAKKPIYMETTEVPAERTASEVSAVLVQAGALSVSMRYENGKLCGMFWTMRVNGAEVPFTMPARIEPVYQLLKSRRSGWLSEETKTRIREQSERVAWRQLLRWVQAQLAMIEVGMVKNAEPFLPYVQQADGTTLFEFFESKQLALAAAQEPVQ